MTYDYRPITKMTCVYDYRPRLKKDGDPIVEESDRVEAIHEIEARIAGLKSDLQDAYKRLDMLIGVR